MQQPDFPQFVRVMRDQGEQFKTELTDELMQRYWTALKDLALEQVQHGSAMHLRYGKFFPKPVELRPKSERTPLVVSGGDDKAFEAAQRRSIECWDWARAQDEIEFRWRLIDAYLARTDALFGPSELVYAERIELARSAARSLKERSSESVRTSNYAWRVVCRFWPHEALPMRARNIPENIPVATEG